MEQLKALIANLKLQLHPEKIVDHLNNHQKKIIYAVSTVALVGMVLLGWSFYSKAQSEKYSKILHEALIDEQAGNFDKSNAALKGIYESNAPAGVREIASLKYASQILVAGQNGKAVEAYLKINQTRSFDQYIREYAGLIALRTMISDGADKTKITALIKDLESNSKVLKYHVIEQKGIFAWENGDYKEAGEAFKSLAQNPEVPDLLKKRATEMAEIYNEKYPDQEKVEATKASPKASKTEPAKEELKDTKEEVKVKK